MTDLSHKNLSGINPYELHSRLGLTIAPFDPFDIAKRLGIEVNQELTFDKIGLSGYITNQNGKVSIWVNPLDSEPRQRFTLAHELGHFIHDILVEGKVEIKDTPQTMFRSGQAHPCETRANKFAGMLLMPKDLVIQHTNNIISQSANKSVPLSEAVEKLANIFGVSKPAMLVRLKALGMVSQQAQV